MSVQGESVTIDQEKEQPATMSVDSAAKSAAIENECNDTTISHVVEKRGPDRYSSMIPILGCSTEQSKKPFRGKKINRTSRRNSTSVGILEETQQKQPECLTIERQEHQVTIDRLKTEIEEVVQAINSSNVQINYLEQRFQEKLKKVNESIARLEEELNFLRITTNSRAHTIENKLQVVMDQHTEPELCSQHNHSSGRKFGKKSQPKNLESVAEGPEGVEDNPTEGVKNSCDEENSQHNLDVKAPDDDACYNLSKADTVSVTSEDLKEYLKKFGSDSKEDAQRKRESRLRTFCRWLKLRRN